MLGFWRIFKDHLQFISQFIFVNGVILILQKRLNILAWMDDCEMIPAYFDLNKHKSVYWGPF